MSNLNFFKTLRIDPKETAYLDRQTASSGNIAYDKQEITLRVFDGTVKGGHALARADLENITVSDYTDKSVESRLATVVYTVTVAGPQAPDVGNKYVLNGVYRPILNLVVGYNYVFNQTDQTNVYFPNANGTTVNRHALNFSADNISGERGDGTSYLTDVEYRLNGTVVNQAVYVSSAFEAATTRQVRIKVTNATPATLYYWCYNHVLMGNAVSIADPGSGSGTASGNVTVSVSNAVPANAQNGNLWLNTNNGSLYVYVTDIDSSQWIQPAVPYPAEAPQIVLPDPFVFFVAADDSTQISIESNNTIQIIGAGGITTAVDADGIVTITGGGSTGNVTFVATTVDSSDSSAITFTPAVVMQSDLTVQNDLVVSNSISAELNVSVANRLTVKDIVLTGQFSSQGSGIPELFSDNEIFITPGTTTILNGLTTFNQTTEVINTKTGATGTVVHDFSIGSVWYHSSLAANFTANFTNVPTTDNRSIVITLILNQGATARIPSAVQISGVGQTIYWFGGSIPSGNINAIDIVSFSLIRIGASWTVLGSLTTYS